MNTSGCSIVLILILFSFVTISISLTWRSLVLTQYWPPTYCLFENRRGNPCKIPTYIKTWQIHGLWPEYNMSVYPHDCNMSTPFQEKYIKDIETQLDLYWKNFRTDQPKTRLWEHEWNKHGRCATEIKQTRNETLYFKSVLSFREKYAIAKYLDAKHLRTNTSYPMKIFKSAIESGVKNDVVMLCLKVNEQYLISDIYICMNRSFQVISCKDLYSSSKGNDSFRICPDKDIFYPPL